MSGTPIDAAAALALTADLYRQLSDARQKYAALRAQHDQLLATVRASVDLPDAEAADSRSTAAPPGADS